MTMSSGFRQPAFIGISASTRVRKTYSTAALQTADGALKLVGSWGLVPVKSMLRGRRRRSTAIVTAIFAPLSIS